MVKEFKWKKMKIMCDDFETKWFPINEKEFKKLKKLLKLKSYKTDYRIKKMM